MSIVVHHRFPEIRYEQRPDLPEEVKSLILRAYSHRPRELLNITRRYTNSFDFQSWFSIEEFHHIYMRCKRGTTTVETVQADKLSHDLKCAMDALDHFFFGGNMTSSHDPPVRLFVEDNIFAEGKSGGHLSESLSTMGMSVPLGNGKTDIYINTHGCTIDDNFDTLVHEMAHTVFLSFACGCPEVLGPVGHGQLWKEMAEHMRDTIRSRGRGLENFMDNDHIQWHFENFT